MVTLQVPKTITNDQVWYRASICKVYFNIISYQVKTVCFCLVKKLREGRKDKSLAWMLFKTTLKAFTFYTSTNIEETVGLVYFSDLYDIHFL